MSSTFAKKPAAGVLAIDIGNTSTHFCLYSNGKLRRELRVATRDIARVPLKKRLPWKNIGVAAIASVVPPAGLYLKKSILRLDVPAYLIGKDLSVPMVNRYKDPRQVGVDRLMNAVAAYRRFAGACIVIDFGTAITFDVVSRRGEYLGGVIAPGIETTIEALFQKTALLPRVRLTHPHGIIGKDTAESIRAGCSFGIGGLCDRVVEEISRQQKTRPHVIATGGYARFMAAYCRTRFEAIDPYLIMKGILLTTKATLGRKRL